MTPDPAALRTLADRADDDSSAPVVTLDTATVRALCDAADEVERLRSDLFVGARAADDRRAEINRLRTERDAARAEVERLRAAAVDGEMQAETDIYAVDTFGVPQEPRWVVTDAQRTAWANGWRDGYAHGRRTNAAAVIVTTEERDAARAAYAALVADLRALCEEADRRADPGVRLWSMPEARVKVDDLRALLDRHAPGGAA